MLKMNCLLGKWRNEETLRPARGFKLSGHMAEVLWGFELLTTQPFFGEQSFLHLLHKKMAIDGDFDIFYKQCFLSVMFHDIGKAGGEFQTMLWTLEDEYQQKKKKPASRYAQAFRHEFLSGLILFNVPEVRTYIESIVGPGRPFFEVLAGAAGHHIKADTEKGLRAEVFEDTNTWKPKPVYLDQWSKHIAPLFKKFNFPAFPVLRRVEAKGERWLNDHDGMRKAWIEIISKLNNSEKRESKRSAAIKWVTILSDTYGSMDVSLPGDINGNAISDTFYAKALRDLKTGIEKDLHRIGTVDSIDFLSRARRKLKFAEGETLSLNEMQQASCVKENLILTASTGGGKTIAGLSWASVFSEQRLIFACHTTDAATVLYRDYGDPEEDALSHSRAWMDKCILRPTFEDNAKTSKEEEEELYEGLRLLQDGEAEINFCTADQVLGLLAFYRKSILWLPYLLTAQIAFDEIHSYDAIMRGWYRGFLECFPGIRTLHLSATLAQAQVDKIRTIISARYDTTTYENSASALAPRYRIIMLDSPPSSMPDRCLWFCNIVSRCQDKAQEHGAVSYHSRFKFQDRVQSRKVLIEGFRSGRSDVRVIATQVAEMSLDVSAYVMISEVAPPSSMIQRLGRLNREPNPAGVREIFIYRHDSEPTSDDKEHHGFPYSKHAREKDWKAEYDLWETWLRDLSGRDISQKELEISFQLFMRNRVARDRAVIPDLIQTRRLSVRDESFTSSVLLKSDFIEDMSDRELTNLEFQAVLSVSRIRELKNTGEELKGRLLVTGEDGSYSSQYGWSPAKQ